MTLADRGAFWELREGKSALLGPVAKGSPLVSARPLALPSHSEGISVRAFPAIPKNPEGTAKGCADCISPP